METRFPPLRLPSRARFRDRWQGTVEALEVTEDWELINLVVRRGLLGWTATVKLPFSAASAWSEECVAFGCSSYEAFRREVPPVAAPGRVLSRDTAVTGTPARVAGALVGRADRRIWQLIIGTAGEERRLPVEEASFEEGGLRAATQLEKLAVYRTDAELLAMVREALSMHPHLTPDDRRSISVEVWDGVVRLSGNARTAQAAEAAAEAAAAVPGALRLSNEVVDDGTLELAIARALTAAGLTRSGYVHARSAQGDVELYGDTPTAGVAEEIERAVSRLPGVRSVTNRLDVRAAAKPAGAAPASG